MPAGGGRGGATRQQQYFDAILRILGVNFSKHPPPSAHNPFSAHHIAMALAAFCNFNCFWLTLLRIANCGEDVEDVTSISHGTQQCPPFHLPTLLHFNPVRQSASQPARPLPSHRWQKFSFNFFLACAFFGTP